MTAVRRKDSSLRGSRLLALFVFVLALAAAGLVRAWSGGNDGRTAFQALRKAPSSVSLPRGAGSRVSVSRITVAHALSHGSSIPVRAMEPVRFGAKVHSRLSRPERESLRSRPAAAPSQPDGAVQARAGVRKAPRLTTGFEGINSDTGAAANGGHFWSPPDTTGDVGPNNYVEAVNTELAVYDKQGRLIGGPSDLKQLWAGLPHNPLCSTNDDGDPIVVYDRLANRWLISQFAVEDPDNYHECVAISKTGDPTGAYWSYDFQFVGRRFNDYPKIGVWPNGYYATFNDSVGNDFAGVTVAAFERAKMLNGQDAGVVAYHTNFPADQDYSMLPANLTGRLSPPASSPALFVESFDGQPDRLEIWSFHVDFNALRGMFSKVASLPTAPFDSDLCHYELDCLPQPGTLSGLDAVSDRLMQPLSYRNFGDHESMVVNQAVDVTGHDRAAVRWYELRRSGGQWTIAQQSTYAPDSANRWMGSLAMDGNGNLALGYSVSSSSIFPSLRYATRLAGDASGKLGTETTMIAGGGSQTSDGHRWGDYSTMVVDPTDDCTFWFVGEYYTAPTTELDWKTRIGQFRLPSCVGVTGFSPQSGDVGATVTVTGVGFTQGSQVRFSGIAAPTTFVSATSLTATVPAGGRTGQISVTAGPSTGLSAGTFTVNGSAPVPLLGGFSPGGGITGSTVVITGSGFQGATAVTFGGKPAASFSVLSATSIQARVPDGATAGPVSVTTPSGTATSADSYSVTLSITGFSPLRGRVGTRVTIAGIGFKPAPIVRLNGKRMTKVRVSTGGTRIGATVPTGARSGKITVQNKTAPVGTVTSPGTFTKR